LKNKFILNNQLIIKNNMKYNQQKINNFNVKSNVKKVNYYTVKVLKLNKEKNNNIDNSINKNNKIK
jgi:hypothetical protein